MAGNCQKNLLNQTNQLGGGEQLSVGEEQIPLEPSIALLPIDHKTTVAQILQIDSKLEEEYVQPTETLEQIEELGQEDPKSQLDDDEPFFEKQLSNFKLLSMMKSETIWNYERRREAVTSLKELKKAQCALAKDYKVIKTFKNYVYEEDIPLVEQQRTLKHQDQY